MATAPPNGRVLATSDPARLTINALVWVIPGREPVIVKVTAISALSCSKANSARAPGCSPRNGSTISIQPTPATLGSPQTSSATARAMERPSRASRNHTFRCCHQGRLTTSSCTWPECHGRPGVSTFHLFDTRDATARAGSVDHAPKPSGSGTGRHRFAGAWLSAAAVTVLIVPPSTSTETGAADVPDTGTSPQAAVDQPAGSRWLRRLWAYCWRHPVITLLAGLSAVGGVGLGALTPLLTQVAVDDATAGETGNLGWVIAGLVGLALIRFGSSFLRRWAGGRLSLDVQHDMRQDVFGALQRLDGSGQDRLRTGQVVSRASTDLQMVQSLLAMVPLSAGQVVLFVVSLVIMLTLSPLLTLMALLVVPAVVLVTRATRTVLFPATWAAQQSAAEVAEIVEEDVTGVRVVKGFGQEDRELGRLRDGARRLFANRMRAVRLTAKISPGLQALTALGQVVAPTRMLTMLLVLGQQARASVERVLEIIDSLPEITERTDPQPLPDGPLSVEFAGVRFGYTPEEPVLAGFDLKVAAGSTVALVGASGSGKSTVSLLL